MAGNRSALGIDLGGTNIKWGIVSENGRLLANGLVPTEPRNGPEALLAKLSGIAKEAQRRARSEELALAGVGIGTAGQVHRESGAVKGATAALPGWAGVPLGERIERETGLPVIVDNDVNMIALGEAWLGAGRHWCDFVCVALGTGVGGCLIADRRVYAGRHGYAGEFGHMTVELDGRECSCGGRGCWEAYASVTALIRMAGEAQPDGSLDDPRTLFARAREGDAAALELADKYSSYVAAGLAGLIHIFNPPAIVLGGAIVAGQGDFLLERIKLSLKRRVMPAFQSPEPVAIVAAELGGHAGVIGSALAALKR